MNTMSKTLIGVLLLFTLFSGCVQQPQQNSNTPAAPSNDSVDDYTAQQVSDIDTGDLSDLGTELDEVSSTLDEIEQADVDEIDTTQ